ncbi:MAG TPA: hypothetical protein VGX28_10505 [Frankiaceae bacterium]|jgi:hypothetical protein|nr:hypothetical protein [Frankiaceae bacterium]
MTRLVLAAALAAGVALPASAHADESCYYRSRLVQACRDPEYRACLLYGAVAGVPYEAGNGCP